MTGRLKTVWNFLLDTMLVIASVIFFGLLVLGIYTFVLLDKLRNKIGGSMKIYIAYILIKRALLAAHRRVKAFSNLEIALLVFFLIFALMLVAIDYLAKS